MKYLFSLILFGLLCTNILAKEGTIRNTFFCNDSLGSIPIRQGGRVKPLYVHAKEVIKYMTGKRSFEGLSSIQTYCLLSLEGMSLKSDLNLTARVDHVEVQKFLELEPGEKTIPLKDLIDEIPRIQREVRKVKFPDAKTKALQTLMSQTGLYKDIVSGTNWLFPAVTRDRVDWIPLKAFLTEEKIVKAKSKTDKPFLKVINDEVEKYNQLKGKDHLLEYRFSKANLPLIAMALTLLALISLTLFKKFTLSLVFSFSTIAVQLALITIRVLISGRAPITNMYETVLFSGFGALTLSLIV
ncbi:MAG: hypothetical protein NXH75_10040, partial [Halobacteriovoraceae bacterium]|nr:hypothetical protein [Halobacteriovoraceae bacterium]